MEEKLEHILGKASLDIQEVLDIRKGKHNLNVIVDSSEGKVVVRTPQTPSHSHLETEAGNLDFLENKGVEGVPRKIEFVKSSVPVLVETFLGSRELEAGAISQERAEDVAKFLARIHSIPVESYNSFHGETEAETVNLEQVYWRELEKFSIQRLNEYRENGGEKTKKLQKLLEKQKELIENHELDMEVKRSLVHGDPVASFRVSGDRIFLIDWEFSRIGYPVHEVIYFLRESSMERKEEFLSAYREQTELKIPDVVEKIYPRFRKYGVVFWAAMMRAKAEKIGREDNFRRIMDRKISELEERGPI